MVIKNDSIPAVCFRYYRLQKCNPAHRRVEKTASRTLGRHHFGPQSPGRFRSSHYTEAINNGVNRINFKLKANKALN